MAQSYQWKRYWSERDAAVNLESDGYLADPESKYGHIYNPAVSPVDLLSSEHCLVLLGEPGIGKSYTLAAERQYAEERVASEDGELLWVDLHEIGSDYQLDRRVFDTSTFQEWKSGAGELYLFLDSFDECRIQVATLPSLVLAKLRDCDAPRLYLRVSCRTADWPASLEDGLRDLFSDGQVAVRELLPLRRVDVADAAAHAGIADPEAFLEAVERAGVGPLAAKPTPLQLLINIFKQHTALPGRHADLYREGCRLLCEEAGARQGSSAPVLSARRRLAVAGRIAAVSVFGNFAVINQAVNRGDIPEGDLTIDALVGGTEVAEGGSFAVDAAAIRDTLKSGLFSSRGANRLGWSHRTYAEFLAADYLVKRNLKLPQIRSLIVHPDDPDERIVPQLHETAAWLTELRRDVFRDVLERDPEVILLRACCKTSLATPLISEAVQADSTHARHGL